MNICQKIENQTGLSGHAISKKLEIEPSQWYRWRDRDDWAVKWSHLAVLAEMCGGWLALGKLIQKERESRVRKNSRPIKRKKEDRHGV